MEESGVQLPRRSKRIKTQKSPSNRDQSIITTTNNEASSKFFTSTVSDDVLFEILLRLDLATYAIHCSTVCKRWRSLITSPQFITEFAHRNLHYRHRGFELLFLRLKRMSKVSHLNCSKLLILSNEPNPNHFPDFLPWRKFKLRASSHDLWLLSQRHENAHCVCNHITRQWLILPKPVPVPPRPNSRLGLVHDQRLIRNYKVVLIEARRPRIVNNLIKFNAMVFSSETRAWSRSTLLAPDSVYRFPIGDAVASSNGVLYFPLKRRRNRIRGLLAFSPFRNNNDGQIQCRFIEMPEEFEGGWRGRGEKVRLGLVFGRLRVSEMIVKKRKQVHSLSLKVWELSYGNDDDEESGAWVLVHDVSLRKSRMCVVAFHPNESDAIFVLKDRLRICKFKIGGEEEEEEEDKFEEVGRLPISKDYYRIDKFIKVFTLMHTSWPTTQLLG